MAKEMLLTKSKVKEQTEMNLSEEFVNQLNEKVAALIEDAEDRAEKNGRKTLKPQDV